MPDLKPIFPKPFGSSEIFTYGNDPMGIGVGDGVSGYICELCGTVNYPKDDLWLFDYCGRKGVVSCCGRLLDILYKRFGEMFFEQSLKDFTKDPKRFDYCSFPRLMREALEEARRPLKGLLSEIDTVLAVSDQ